MFWTTGLVLVALVFGQAPAELTKPVYIEDALPGEPSTVNTRIVSGWEAYPGQHPHQASLRIVDAGGGVGACGGSVVHRRWVITAAHCTALRVTVVVRAGVTNLTTPEYLFETTEWWNHPTFNENRPDIVQPNDISIMKLQVPVTYSKLLQPIRIQPSADEFANYDREVVIASGWGRLWTNGAQPEVLNWVYLNAISNAACAQVFGTALITEAAICASWYNVTSQSTCQGDSGGPLVHVNSDGVPVLIGIASFVAGGTWGCHSGLPAGFIRPGPFHGWLKEITGLDFDNLNEEDDVTETPETTTTAVTVPSTTTVTVPSTTEVTKPPTTEPEKPEPDSEEDEDDESDSDSDEDESEEDPEISELLKKLIVKVKVKVKINNKVKRKIKVKCVDKL